MARRRRSLRVAAALAVVATAAGCGGDPAASVAAPTPPPDSSGVSRLTAEGLPSPYRMELAAHLDLRTLAAPVRAHHDEPIADVGPLSGAGCWGYTSPDGRRLALVGTSVGLSVVDVTDPRAPRPVAFIAGAESRWREVKTYRHYAYVTTEARTGLDIVDLQDPQRPRKVGTWNRTFRSAHTLWVDEERGLVFVNGADYPPGGYMRILDVGSDPEAPVELGRFTAFYVHDSYHRGTTLFASAIFEGIVGVLDVSNPAQVREISRFRTGGGFTHNSWLTEDGRFLFTTDEVANRPVEGWDLSDPAAPRKVMEYIGRSGTIPHNVMIDGDRLLIAHYTEGVHLLDVRDPESPRVLGAYDTYQGSSQGFAGAWGAYLFPGSDLIVVSDIDGGLYVVRYTG